jgi:hypothetical protein
MHAAQLTYFETKHHYFVIRPSQAEPRISLVIPLPTVALPGSIAASISTQRGCSAAQSGFGVYSATGRPNMSWNSALSSGYART